jgi:NAD(P)H dehydrogenase (quinone)
VYEENHMSTILVTGASGELGRQTIEFLLKRVPAGRIAALVRDERKAADLARQGVIVRQGDYTDPESLERAFRRVDKLLLISTSMFSDATAEHGNVVAAAAKVGVRHVMYTGIQSAPASAFSIPVVTATNQATERALAESGMAFTLLRNGLYQDALPLMLGAIRDGAVRVPAGSSVVAAVARRDLAEANAILLAGDDHEGKSYTLTAAESVSLDEIAAIIGRARGQNVSYIDTPLDDYVAARVAEGLPAPVASFLAQWFVAIAKNEFAEASDDLARILGRAPLAARDFLPGLFSR